MTSFATASAFGGFSASIHFRLLRPLLDDGRRGRSTALTRLQQQALRRTLCVI